MLSFSLVPGALVGMEVGSVVPLITRRHGSANAAARAAFEQAFDRCNAAGLAFAGLAALAGQLGMGCVIGLAGARHLSWKPEAAAQFTNSYDSFWQTLGARPCGPLGHLIPLPPAYPAVEAMAASKRARALRRRRHIAEVTVAAGLALEALVQPPRMAADRMVEPMRFAAARA